MLESDTRRIVKIHKDLILGGTLGVLATIQGYFTITTRGDWTN